MFSAFAFDVIEGEQAVGEFIWPVVARAKNARLALIKDPLKGGLVMTLYGRKYAVPFEYLRRGWTCDVGFDLIALDTPEVPVCTAKALAVRRGIQITIASPEPVGFFIPPVSLGLDAEIFQGTRTIGRITSPRGLKLKKSLVIDCGVALDRDVTAFALLMALNALNR